MAKKPLILVTNDDGVTAPGINAMVEVACTFGYVVVVAPDKPQSAMGHAITINSTLRIHKLTTGVCSETYSTTGTPVDCVKLAINKILNRKPDLILSGINHGSNASINVIYSGTMSAAVEGAMEGVPSIGISLMSHSIDADFSAAMEIAAKVINKALENGMEKGTCWNVNIPNVPMSEIRGIKVCRQANANWEEEFDERTDPMGGQYYWLTGKFVNYDSGDDTDIVALENNYVSLVPVQYDMTAHRAIKTLKNLFEDA